MPEADPLALDVETMRRLGYRTVDMLVARLADPAGGPALRGATPQEMRGRVGGPPPREGESFERVLERLQRDVLPFASRCEHPRYFAFIPACGTWPAALGDFIAAATNHYCGSWQEAAGPSQVELEVLRWFADWVGYPSGARGVLVGGGSQANMTALACAREARLGAMTDTAVAYVSDQGHSSLARAARVLGFQPQQVRVLPVDEHYRMRPGALQAAIAADRERGRQPLFAAASAGSTNTGAVDPLAEIAAVCAEQRVWLHVDAAYGGFASLTERGRSALAGIERADSITLDPHKWLYQPFECGCVLVRDGRLLREAFEIVPDYLRDAQGDDDEVNFADLGMQLSRGFRALKVWMSIRCFGTQAFTDAIDGCLDLAQEAQRRIESLPGLELLNAASLGVVCFRRRPGDARDEDELDAINARLVARFAASGEGLVSSTRLRGRYAIRLCILNHTTRSGDVAQVIDWFAHAPARTRPAPAPGPRERHPAVARALGTRTDAPLAVPEADRVAVEDLRRLALFAGVDGHAMGRIQAAARLRTFAAGETIVEQWSEGSDFFLVLDGQLDVLRDQRLVDAMGPGDFFGEIAALEWGGGFGYARVASIVARTEARLAVLRAEALAALLVELPEFARTVLDARRERLARS